MVKMLTASVIATLPCCVIIMRVPTLAFVCILAVIRCITPTTLLASGEIRHDEIHTITSSALKTMGNAGTEFYVTFLPCYEESADINKLLLYIASTSEGTVTVEVAAKNFTVTKDLVANDVVSIELAPGIGQVFSKSTKSGIPPEQVYQNAAVHITATVPVVVCAATRFSFTSGTYLALPVQTLGREYIVSSMADMSWMYSGLSLPSETAIVAAYDGTEVEFTLGGPLATVSSGGMRSGQFTTFTMNKGDVWIIGNGATNKESDLTGSKVKASKPVGVISGNQCANVPTNIRWCDFITEMEIPTSMWGRYLQLPRNTSRTNGYFMKVFAKEPNTRVSYNGSLWKVIQTAGGKEGTGWIYQRVDATGNNVLSLSADKPISATVFNTGQEDDNVAADPSQMNILPVEQYQTSMIFSTPGTRNGVGFTSNLIGIIFEVDAATQGIPADLEFGVTTNGQWNWRPLSAVFGPLFATRDIFQQRVNGKLYAFKECSLPGDNLYGLRCSTPFMCYCYGGSNYESYGHPAGFKAISDSTTAVGSEQDDGIRGTYIEGLSPNPARDQTVVTYSLDHRTDVEITIADVHGRIVASLPQGVMEAGIHRLTLDLQGLVTGAYGITLRTARSNVSVPIVVNR